MAHPIYQDILPIFVYDIQTHQAVSFEGTGFILSEGLFITCWHCVRKSLANRHAYIAVRQDDARDYKMFLLSNIAQDTNKKDLATAKINVVPKINFLLSKESLYTGENIFTYGYPFTDCQSFEGNKLFTLNARYLEGYITRAFHHEYSDYGKTPSYELNIACLEGLSGSPLIKKGTKEVVGVIYGNNDIAKIEEFERIDPETGGREPEIQRLVHFGLAHYTESLWNLRTNLTNNLPLKEFLIGKESTT